MASEKFNCKYFGHFIHTYSGSQGWDKHLRKVTYCTDSAFSRVPRSFPRTYSIDSQSFVYYSTLHFRIYVITITPSRSYRTSAIAYSGNRYIISRIGNSIEQGNLKSSSTGLITGIALLSVMLVITIMLITYLVHKLRRVILGITSINYVVIRNSKKRILTI